jgi:2,4-dienoyl-CoA reductase-like NADH-dependent reductase (Old Yellow Enzyme family)
MGVYMSHLFSELQIGDLTIKNKIIMSPLTRCRAIENRVPNKLMAEYYAQRASVGLIISEATAVTPMGVGYPNTPGIWNDEQVEGWKLVTKAVHDKGGKIFLQLWHVGRVSDPIYLDGKLPVAPSAIGQTSHVSLVRPKKQHVTPRALELNEIPEIVQAFKKGAENAKKAGFDGVELHGANGYLLDQFLQDNTNKRTDVYGGSIENRARFALEVTDAAISVWGANRVGYHFSPRCDDHEMGDSKPLATFTYLMEQLKKRKLAFVFSRSKLGEGSIDAQLKKAFGGIYIRNEGLTKETAENLLKNNEADAVAFGKLIIANPDLVERFKNAIPLNDWNAQTFYCSGAEGYTDYPRYTV